MTYPVPTSAARRPSGFIWILLLMLISCRPDLVWAQNLRFSNHRDIEIPDYATIMLGPFYSQLTFSQTLAYRYTTTSGAGTDFIFSNNKGSTLEDGDEFPMVSTLSCQNYLVISRNMDLEFTATLTYMHFPMGTQEDEFNFELGDEGAIGNLSAEFRLSDNLKGTLYDDISLTTDFVDSRGESDPYGGDRYEVLENTVGMKMDWLVTRSLNVPLTLERTDTMPLDGEFDDQEAVTTTPELGVEYELAGFLMVGFNSSYAFNTYPASDRPDSTILAYETFAQIQATRQSQVRAAIGRSLGTTEDAEDGTPGDETDAITGELRLHTNLSEALSHDIYWSRSLSAGFESDFDITDTYGYLLEWKGELASATLTSKLSDVQPSGGDGVTAYSDWLSSADLTLPITEDLALTLSTSYDIRDNGTADSTSDTEQPVDTTEDYETWISKIATSFYLMQDLTMVVSFEHMERYSDTPELSYGRDIGAVELTYTHAF